MTLRSTLRGVARCEGSGDRLRLFVRGGGGSVKLVTWALVVSVILMLVMTAAVTYGMIAGITPAGA